MIQRIHDRQAYLSQLDATDISYNGVYTSISNNETVLGYIFSHNDVNVYVPQDDMKIVGRSFMTEQTTPETEMMTDLLGREIKEISRTVYSRILQDEADKQLRESQRKVPVAKKKKPNRPAQIMAFVMIILTVGSIIFGTLHALNIV